MELNQLSVLMILVGGFTFLSCGICVGNSIEAKESELTSKILTSVCLMGGASFIFGFIILAIVSI